MLLTRYCLGAHRFTFTELNLVIAATDLSKSNDRITNKPHYSKLRSLERVYGLEGLYKDRKQVNDDILLFLESEYKEL
jgi:hypothetical protein